MPKHVSLAIGSLFTVALIAGGCSWNTNTDTTTTTPDAPAPAAEQNTEPNTDTSTTEQSEPFTAADGRYALDVNASAVEWNGRFSVGDRGHNGTVDLQEGWMSVEDGELTGGEAVIDMSTITAYNYNVPIGGSEIVSRLVTHLQSEDFFAVETYPAATFTITGVQPATTESATYILTGNMTIKDQTHEITVPATFTTTEAGYELRADFEIDRSRWDVRYGSENFFDNLGDRAIDNEIRYSTTFIAHEPMADAVTETETDAAATSDVQ